LFGRLRGDASGCLAWCLLGEGERGKLWPWRASEIAATRRFARRRAFPSRSAKRFGGPCYAAFALTSTGWGARGIAQRHLRRASNRCLWGGLPAGGLSRLFRGLVLARARRNGDALVARLVWRIAVAPSSLTAARRSRCCWRVAPAWLSDVPSPSSAGR